MLLFLSKLSGQEKIKVYGEVLDINLQKVDYFNITLLIKDSLLIESGTFIDGYFEFDVLRNQSYIIRISSNNAAKDLNFAADATLDLGKIILDIIILEEAIVTPNKKLFRQEKGKLIVDVQGSSLSSAGSLIEAMKKSPGLIVDSQNNINVFGKGSPLILIDGKEIISKEELEALQSSDIDKIEIDRNPSAQYSASGHAVVSIKTKRIKKDLLSILLYDNFTISRRSGNIVGLQLNNKRGKLKNLISYSYGRQNYKDYSGAYETRMYQNYTIENNSNIISNYGYNVHRLFTGNEYSLSGHRIGLQFTGYWNDTDSYTATDQIISKTNERDADRSINQNKSTIDNLYDANLIYQLNPDSSNTLSAIFSYAYKNKNTENIIRESGYISNIKNMNKYNIYSAKIDYKFNLKNIISASVGIRYANVKNKGNSKSVDGGSGLLNYDEENDIDDKIAAAYMQFEKEYGAFSISGGLRVEHTNSKIKSNELKIDTSYNNLFLSLSIALDLSENIGMNVSYSRRIRRPLFAEINPNIIYFDSLSYGAGNSFLLPEYSNNVELSADLFDFTFSAAYTLKNDIIVNTAINDKDNQDIIVYTYNNINKGHIVSAGITYSKSFKFYSGSIEGYVDKPYVKVPYLEETIIRKQATWYFNFRNEVKIFKNFDFNLDFQYNSAGDDGITHYNSYYNLSAGMNLFLFNRKLQLSLTANDLLNKYEPNSWEDRYRTIVSGMRSDQDYKWFRFGIRYNFNNFKSSISKRSSNSEEINRL
jgi:outer membrane receptor protein involved in Fe transport